MTTALSRTGHHAPPDQASITSALRSGHRVRHRPDVHGAAVLLHTGDDARFGTPAYSENRHFLTRAGATWLVDHCASLVGIDALNIDDTADGE